MNIFVTDPSPRVSAQSLPDKHIVKMPLETCQMASVIYSKHHWDWEPIHKKDGEPYRTTGGFKHHPCTVWAAKSYENFAWMLSLGFEMCWEYTKRYGKQHTCEKTLNEAMCIFHNHSQMMPPDKRWHINDYVNVKDFVFAGPDEFKYDKSIDIFTAYQRYIASKPWAPNNYLRIPERKPEWIG